MWFLPTALVIFAEGGTEALSQRCPQRKELSSFLERNKEMGIDAENSTCRCRTSFPTSSHAHYEVILDIGHTRTLCVLCLEGKAILIRVLSQGIGLYRNSVHYPLPHEVSCFLPPTDKNLWLPMYWSKKTKKIHPHQTLLLYTSCKMEYSHTTTSY